MAHDSVSKLTTSSPCAQWFGDGKVCTRPASRYCVKCGYLCSICYNDLRCIQGSERHRAFPVEHKPLDECAMANCSKSKAKHSPWCKEHSEPEPAAAPQGLLTLAEIEELGDRAQESLGKPWMRVKPEAILDLVVKACHAVEDHPELLHENIGKTLVRR
jgi:hypothetical protein